MSFDDDDLSFELEEDDEKPPPKPAVPRKKKRKRIEGFYEEYTETKEEDGKIVRRGKRSSYDHSDWRWESRYEGRVRNLFWFAAGFFAFAIFRAVVLFG